MANLKFEKWCMDAACKIVFPQDRRDVERELYQHMLDHYEDELKRGIPPKEAERRTLEAMGAPEDIALELSMIHRPFWGRFHQLSRQLLTAVAVLSLFCLSAWLLKSYVLYHTFSAPVYYRYDPFQDHTYFDNAGRAEKRMEGRPGLVAYSDGYLFVLREYALWQESYTDTQGESQKDQAMYLQLQVISLTPWASHTDISRWFSARDDLGNHYSPAYQRSNGASLRSSIHHTAPCVYTHILSFTDTSSGEASRLELCYDRAGREITLGIDLTGETKK